MRKFRQQNERKRERDGERESGRANQAGREQRQHPVELLVEWPVDHSTRQTIEQLEMHIQSDIDTNTVTVTVADTVTVSNIHTDRQTD